MGTPHTGESQGPHLQERGGSEMERGSEVMTLSQGEGRCLESVTGSLQDAKKSRCSVTKTLPCHIGGLERDCG